MGTGTGQNPALTLTKGITGRTDVIDIQGECPSLDSKYGKFVN